jgi:L-ascorbate metabolism protein UlaG (beta-lactamase superfamily)
MSRTALTYVGGPTAILDYAGFRWLTDPTFDEPGRYEDPDGSALVKTAGPGVAIGGIGPIDVVLLSHHLHEDNLDVAGATLLTGTVFSTPEAAADRPGVIGLRAWESRDHNGVTVTAVPALHGPPGCEDALGTVTGFMLEAPGEPTVYVSGDNASLDHVREIAARFGSIDLALLFAGAARIPEIDAPLTLTSKDAAEAARILGVTEVVGLHTEDWEHFSETRTDLEAAFAGSRLLVDTPRGVRVELLRD